jgi:mono/diheme cytochrome c family protein
VPAIRYPRGKLCYAVIFIVFTMLCGNSTAASPGPCEGLTVAAGLPSSNPLSGDPAAMREGCVLYRKWCRQCHGEHGNGQGVRWSVGAKDLRKYWRGFSEFVAIVVAGRPKQQMPPWGSVLKGEEIMQIGAYLETLAVEGANWKDTK